MTRSSDATSAPSIPTAELIGLFPDPAVLFDKDGTLAVANAEFLFLCAAIEPFIRQGTPWELFLTEAERRAILPAQTCADLRRREELLLLQPDEVPPVHAALADGTHAKIVLTALSDGGFALRLQRGTPSEQDEREIEQVMAKVLEACPTSLTMARIGDGQILYRSPSATDLLGKGMSSYDHFARREERADFVTALLPDARVDDMRITGRKADGSEFPAAISARLIDYRGEDVAVYSILNLSDEIAL
ncbi:MAG: PAS domain-containing protein, partial [Pseudomonadota bacterium]